VACNFDGVDTVAERRENDVHVMKIHVPEQKNDKHERCRDGKQLPLIGEVCRVQRELQLDWSGALCRGKNVGCPSRSPLPALIESHHAACIAAYKLVLNRRFIEALTIEMWLTLVKTSPAYGAELLTEAAVQEFNRHDRETTEMFERVWKLFPSPNVKSAEKKLPVPMVEQPPLHEIDLWAGKEAKLPATGVMGAKRPGVAQFNVNTPPGIHYVIKLVNVDTKKREITFFVRGDSRFEGKVPLGKYRIVGVYGTTWYGMKDYFGEGSTFFKARLKDGEEVVTFYKDEKIIHGKTLTLKGVVDGNLTTPPIDRADFEAN
jgi:hypothetical protein